MRAVVVSASGWPLRLVRWPGARYSVGAVEVPAGFSAGERAAGLTGRRAECGVLDRLVEAVQAGESRALVAVGEPGVGKTVLLEYLAGRAARYQVAGMQSEMELAYGALVMAVAVRGGAVPGVIMHTDQGSEYTAGLFRAACERLGISQSMGRPGSALDNAVIESWHSTLEFELRRVEHFATRAAARAGVAAWIEDYNHHRRHSACGRVSPVDYELAAGGKGRRVSAAGRRCAAQNQKEAASPPLTFLGLPRSRPGDAPREGTGPPLRRQACCRTACAAALRAGLDPGDLCDPSGRKYGQAPACPAQGAARPEPLPGEHRRTPGERSELAFDTQKKRRNYTNQL